MTQPGPPRSWIHAPRGSAPIRIPDRLTGAGQVTLLTRRTSLAAVDAHAVRPVRDGAIMLLGSATATLDTIHVRAPGEHRVIRARNGQQVAAPAAEIQLRFRASEGAQVCLAIPVVSGSFNQPLQDLIDGTLDLHGLLPRPRELAAYHGGDTIPPFQEPTMWLVASTPVTARSVQLAAFLHGRAPRGLPPRSLQASDGRPVVRMHAKLLLLRDTQDGHLART